MLGCKSNSNPKVEDLIRNFFIDINPFYRPYRTKTVKS